MRLHYFQHEPFEGLGAIEEWASARNAKMTSTHFYKGEEIDIQVEDIDWLVIMGGSMSVNDEEILPWLVKEKQFVRKAIESGKTVIGICLGAQMIANVLGAKVYQNKEKEIGWFPIVWEKQALTHPVFTYVPNPLIVLHWHGETFDLPKGALHIAHSEACLHQGFLYKEKVLGLQFHMEFTEKSTEEMLVQCATELQKGNYIQEETDIRRQTHYISPAKQALFSILDTLS